MIFTALPHTGLDLEHVVISETHRHYKSSHASPLFKEALARLGTQPEDTVHLGDRSPDLLGATRAGVRCLHIQRDEVPMAINGLRPEASVPDLLAAVAWLEARAE